MSDFSIVDALKGAAWQRVKGELRACADIQGSHLTGTSESPSALRWEKFNGEIERFIRRIEAEELQK